MQKTIKLLELIGIVLVLFSFFIQAFVFFPSQSTTTGAIRYKVEKKIDTIYNITRSNFQKLHPNIKEPIFSSNQKLFSDYGYAEQDSEIEGTYKQTKALKYIVSIVFILGSICMILAKYLDFRQCDQFNAVKIRKTTIGGNMDLIRFQELLDGEEPSLDDYSAFAFVTEHSSIDVLWTLLTQNPRMHWILKSIINKTLQEKIPKEKSQLALQSIIKNLEEKKGVL